MSLDKFVYSESNNENILLNTNVFAIKSLVLDNTWIIGGINDPLVVVNALTGAAKLSRLKIE
jgi:hypothetical protein